MIKKDVESKTMEQISIKLPKSLIERYNDYAKLAVILEVIYERSSCKST